jgi:hypothetical protein
MILGRELVIYLKALIYLITFLSEISKQHVSWECRRSVSLFAIMSMFDVYSDSCLCVDVPIGGTINAVKALEEYLGTNLSSGLEVKL